MANLFESLVRQAERTAIAIALAPEFKEADKKPKEAATTTKPSKK